MFATIVFVRVYVWRWGIVEVCVWGGVYAPTCARVLAKNIRIITHFSKLYISDNDKINLKLTELKCILF